MIDTNFLKTAASLFFAVALIAGCSSTQEQDGGAEGATDGSDQVDTVDTSSVGSEDVDPTAGLDTVFYFDFDKSELRSDVRAALDSHADALRNKSGIVRLEGHTDERGTREYNLALGARRAASARDFLVARGVAANRIRTISYGKERPVATCDDISCWSQNRRAVTVLNGGSS
mgnify:CR=1 FL=1